MKKENKTKSVSKDVKEENVVVEKKAKKEKVVAEKVGAEGVTTKPKFKLPSVPKKVAAAIGGTVLLVIVVIIVVLGIAKGRPEKEVKTRLEDVGTSFYEDFYYKSAGSGDEEARKTFLARFEKIGIKVSLDNLLRYYVTTDNYKKLDIALGDDATVTDKVKDLEEKWFKSKKYDCNVDETKVIIYPKESYGEKDYTLEVVTSCGFKSEKTTEKAE